MHAAAVEAQSYQAHTQARICASLILILCAQVQVEPMQQLQMHSVGVSQPGDHVLVQPETPTGLGSYAPAGSASVGLTIPQPLHSTLSHGLQPPPPPP